MPLVFCPKSHVLFVHAPAEMEVGLITEEDVVSKILAFFDLLGNGDADFEPFPLMLQ